MPPKKRIGQQGPTPVTATTPTASSKKREKKENSKTKRRNLKTKKETEHLLDHDQEDGEVEVDEKSDVAPSNKLKRKAENSGDCNENYDENESDGYRLQVRKKQKMFRSDVYDDFEKLATEQQEFLRKYVGTLTSEKNYANWCDFIWTAGRFPDDESKNIAARTYITALPDEFLREAFIGEIYIYSTTGKTPRWILGEYDLTLTGFEALMQFITSWVNMALNGDLGNLELFRENEELQKALEVMGGSAETLKKYLRAYREKADFRGWKDAQAIDLRNRCHLEFMNTRDNRLGGSQYVKISETSSITPEKPEVEAAESSPPVTSDKSTAVDIEFLDNQKSESPELPESLSLPTLKTVAEILKGDMSLNDLEIESYNCANTIEDLQSALPGVKAKATRARRQFKDIDKKLKQALEDLLSTSSVDCGDELTAESVEAKLTACACFQTERASKINKLFKTPLLAEERILKELENAKLVQAAVFERIEELKQLEDEEWEL